MPMLRHRFGEDESGLPVDVFVLRNDEGFEAWLMAPGATLLRLRVPDLRGELDDVVLGFDRPQDYLRPHPYLGSVVGRHANRIRDGRFELDGVAHQLSRNDGPHHLHGGNEGFDRRRWTPAILDQGDEPALAFSLHSENGDQGYPGALDASVRYTLSGRCLRLDYHATCDAATVVNLTQHAYFNLAGRGDVLEHRLRLPASHYLPVDAQLIPTGERRPVANTAMDFRDGALLGPALSALAQAEPEAPGFDHCFVIDKADGELGVVAELEDARSGRLLRLHSDQPGLQFYSGNFLDGSLVGRGGQRYAKHAGLCLEAQRFPDGPNQPSFPSAVLRPGEVYRQVTVLEFPDRS